jgi:neopullulanase
MFCSSDVRDGDGGKRVDFPGGWQGDAFDLFTPEGRAASNVWNNGESLPAGTYADLYDYVSTLFQWRKTAEVIHNGRTMHFLTRDNTYAYFRYNDAGQKVFVYLNNSHDTKTVPWSSYAEIASDVTSGRNVITGETVDFSAPVTVGPLQALVVDLY